MKKFLMCAVAMLFMGSVAATAQTPEEKQASDERIAVLKADRPKDCGVKPLKLKSATKSLNYAKDVVAAAGEELPYQAKLIKNLIAGN